MSEDEVKESFLRVANRRLAFGLAIAFVIFGWIATSSSHHPLQLIFLLTMPWVAILIHELGHALAATLTGQRLWIVNAYPFAWRRATPALTLCRRDIGSDVGGFVFSTPKSASADTRAGELIATAGGPVASVVVAIICIALATSIWPHIVYEYAYRDQPYRMLIFAFGLYSAAAGVASAWPFTLKDGHKNDAAKIIALLCEREKRPRDTDQAATATHLWGYGITPRSWDAWITNGVDAAAASPDLDWTGQYWAAIRALERGDYRLARSLFGKLILPTNSLDALLVMEAFFAAVTDRDAIRAEALLAGALAEMGGDLQYFRQLTLVLLIAADGDASGARKRLGSLRAELRTAHYPNSFWRPVFDRVEAVIPEIQMQHDPRNFSPSTARNREPILAVMAQHFPISGRVLEIASGAGEHAVFIARALPGLTWQPSDPDEAARESIAAWIAHERATNVLAPIALDVRQSNWGVDGPFDAIVAINMIHISPWDATQGLMAGAARRLTPGGKLFLYGPYKRGGAHTAPSNDAFDVSLRARNPLWGVRDLAEVEAEANANGLTRAAIIEMPANNLSVLFVR